MRQRQKVELGDIPEEPEELLAAEKVRKSLGDSMTLQQYDFKILAFRTNVCYFKP